MNLTARWIWKKQTDCRPYNQTVVARKSFRTGAVRKAELAITADSFYRLYINDEWVNDGPCRSWPEHYQYDLIDVTPYLRTGTNTIEVVARHYGVGTFHQVPQQAGLLVQLEASLDNGRTLTVVSDGTWEVAEARAWRTDVPKISIQREPFEYYDARREALRFSRAAVVAEAHAGPWYDLQPRDCPLLTRQPVPLKAFLEANVVRRNGMSFGFPVARLLHPDKVEANFFTGVAHAVATVVHSDSARNLTLDSQGYLISVNGRPGRKGVYALKAGENLLLAVAVDPFGHPPKETVVRFASTEGIRLENPVKPDHENPWCLIPSEGSDFADIDIPWFQHPSARAELRKAARDALDRLYREITDRASLLAVAGRRARCFPKRMLFEDVHGAFVTRRVEGDGLPFVERPGRLMHQNPETTVVHPSPDGDLELVYDLGQQNVGYYAFELVGHEGAMVDIFAVEYIAPSGRIQHTGDNRNGLRYVCKDGVNRFVSTVRRSGRYLYVTLRGLLEPVELRNLHVIESTYPVEPVGDFACSDPRLDRVWEISAHTLKLCMEDTFTDCPLYEQTLWVGDARNEAIFAFTAFGAADLARRCIELAGQSLERYALVGCQVPSSWDTLLPAWSFLWGISVWDYYEYTGDKDYVEKVWGWVKANLEAAEERLDHNGLFSGPYWNMFDWSGIDDIHYTVLHNSLILVGAVDAARRCAAVLGDKKTDGWLKDFRRRLVDSINRTWNEDRQSYPDSIHEDGSPSPSVCQHTSFLALLYDVVPEEHRDAALRNCLEPPAGMVRVGSPFAIMYLYEALEKVGRTDAIVQSIRESYFPMLEAGATTVWESFASGSLKHDEFPTRSHCHAWSSAPIHFLNRIVLGIRPTAPGGAAFDISPEPHGLDWARGATGSIRGPVRVSWRREGDRISIRASAPEGVKLRFKPNPSLEGLEVEFNGRVQRGIRSRV